MSSYFLKNDMGSLKVYLKDMLKWFDNFCQDNNIRYYALGGTLLGTLRHSGFIPWDDDIDVGIPRNDYERFISLMKDKKGRYIIESPDSSADDFCYNFTKIYDTETTVIEEAKNNIIRGVYIDIFPIDGIKGDSYRKALRYFFPLKVMKIIYSTRIGLHRSPKSYKQMIIEVIRSLPQFVFNDKKLQKKICERCKKYDYDSSKYCGNLVGAYLEREIVPKEYFGKPIRAKFEDIEINIPEKPDKYLENIYGDWKKLPPESDRKPGHNFIKIDLNNSYLKYNK